MKINIKPEFILDENKYLVKDLRRPIELVIDVDEEEDDFDEDEDDYDDFDEDEDDDY